MTTSDFWQQVKILLEQAAALPPDERSDYLVSVCGDKAVRREVIELLRADARPAGWSPAAGHGKAAESQTAAPDVQLDRYRLLRPIGSGGMGTVYLAERRDDGVVQTVAVKLIQSALIGEASLALFRRERRILSALDHPGICPLIDSGTTADGRPYLAMPYLEGAASITDYCAQIESHDRAIAELVIEVCRAVHHAHQNLVVHSDIKPANVMITPEGRVQLLDFGIARMLRADQTDPTLIRSGYRPVSLDYASPEQIRGEPATTQSDVHALGVLLYQVLSGRKPWQLDETCDLHTQLIQRAMPPRHGRRGRLPEDLYNIAVKATAMEPERRYGSALALAEDIEAWLACRPVKARAPGWGYLAGRFVQRNRWPAALAGSVALAAVTLVTVIAVNATRIAEQSRQIALERDRAEATAQFWAGLFDQTDPVRALSPVSGLPELLDRATEQLDSDAAMSAATRAQLLGVISTANWNLARPEPARESAELATQLAAGEDMPPMDRALAWRQLAQIAYARGDIESGRAAADRALAAVDLVDTPDPARLATILDAHALLLDREGRTAEAAGVMQRVIDLQRQLPIERVGLDHAIALTNLAWMHFSLARSGTDPAHHHYALAEPALERALELTRAQFGESHPNLLNLHNAAGTLAMTRERNEQALAHFDAAEAIARSNFPPGHEMLAYLFYNQGVLHWRMNVPERSSRAFAEALEITRSALPDDTAHRVDCLVGLARARLALDDRQAAIPLLQELAGLRAGLAPEDPDHLWHELLDRQARGQVGSGLPEDLLAQIEASGDRDLELARARLSGSNP